MGVVWAKILPPASQISMDIVDLRTLLVGYEAIRASVKKQAGSWFA